MGPAAFEEAVAHPFDPVAVVHVAFGREVEVLAACLGGHHDQEVEAGHDLVDRADQEVVADLFLRLEAFLADLLGLREVD